MTLAPGTRLGPYEIVAPLGAGGMGEVYRARDSRLGREVAIKVLPAEVAGDPERLARFEREAKAVSALNHPHIVTLHETGSSEFGPYLVLEKIEGRSLRELLRDGALPVKRILHLGAQVAEGLAKAHAAGIVHRDLKPENVMVTDDGFAKILDFGLARLVYPEIEGGVPHEMTTLVEKTASGMILGTLGYLSPEQAAGRPADFRSDQFALGALLYELAAGERPFNKETTPETLTAILREEPEPLRAKNAAFPAQLGWIVERCLAKDPNDRYASTKDLARDLADLRDRLSEIGRAEVPSLPASRRRPSHRELVSWLLAAAGLALAAGLWLRARSPSAVAPPPLRVTLLPPDGLELDAGFGLALSPDGARVVFQSSEGSLWLRPLAESVPRRIPGSEGGIYPFWSPDSRTIAFFARDRLFRIGIDEAAPSVVCEAPSARGGSWSASGVILIGSLHGPLRRVAAAGGATTEALPLDPEQELNHRWPSFLPDGRHFVYSSQTLEWTTAPLRLMLGSLDGGPSRQLGESWSGAAFAAPEHVLYVTPPQRTLVARRLLLAEARLAPESIAIATGVLVISQRWNAGFSAATTGAVAYTQGPSWTVRRLTWTDRAGRDLGDAAAPAPFSEVALAPDGRRAVASIEDPDRGTTDLWELDLDRQTSTRLLDAPDDEQRPFWSRDGRDIFYTLRTTSVPSVSIVRHHLGGDTKATVLETTTEGSACDADGERLVLLQRAVASDGTSKQDLWLLPFAGGERQPFRVDRFTKLCGSISPDGRWLAYVSNESGRMEVYVESFPTPARRFQISREGAAKTLWNPRGGELVYLDFEGGVHAVALGGGSEPTVGPSRPLFRSAGADLVGVAPDGERLLLLAADPRAPRTTITYASGWLPETPP